MSDYSLDSRTRFYGLAPTINPTIDDPDYLNDLRDESDWGYDESEK